MDSTLQEPMTDLGTQTKLSEVKSASPTRKQIGEWRRANVTLVNPMVMLCGHKFLGTRNPATDCEECWRAYFKTNFDLGVFHDELLQSRILNKGNPKRYPKPMSALEATYGKKFVEAFGRYLNNELQKGMHGVSEKNSGGTEGEVGTTSDSSGEVQTLSSAGENPEQEV